MVNGDQRELVRELGRKVHELAVSEEYEARRRRWRDVNGLRKPDRSPVWCKPVGCWAELLPESALKCQDESLRKVEAALRRVLIKDDIGDDSLAEPYWGVPAAVEPDGEFEWGVEIKRVRPGTAGGAWRYDPPIKGEEDLDRLVAPRYHHDEAETARRLARAAELFDGVMPVRVTAGLPVGLNLGHAAANLMGLDSLMLALALNGRMVHRLMAFLQAGVMKVMDQVEAMGVLTPNNSDEMFCSDGLRASGEGKPVRVRDLWGISNSQEFALVSPAMWEEFQLDYERPLLERHGLAQYGCCEDLTRKIDGVLSIANLRVFVCSAWTDLGKVVEAVGDRHTIMWRQKASDVVYAPDLGAIERHLNEGMRLSQGCCRQVVLRELQTLAGHPRRLHEWTALAKAAAERFP